MRKKHIILLFTLLLVLALCITGCGNESPSEEKDAADQEYTLKIGHIRPEGSVADNDVNFFKELIEEKSSQKMKIEVYPMSQLGDYTVVQERVKIGDVEMQIAPIGTNLDKGFGVSTAPYLVENWDEARELFSSDGVLIKEMEALLDEHGFKLLGTYPLYFGGIALVDEPASPLDPTVPKGIKIRVPPIKAFELASESMGYIATPLAWADTFTSMQTKIVNGAIGAGAEGYYSSFKDLVKYYLPLNDHFEMWYLYMNKDLFEKMSDENQQILLDAAKQLEDKRFEEAEADTKEYEDMLADLGVEIIPFSEEDIHNLALKVQEEVWPVIREEYGAELWDKITAEIGE